MSLPCSSFSYAPLVTREAVTAQGKFLYVNDRKFFLKGVSYGPFSQATHGTPFPEKQVVEKDFALMVELGANCIRTYTVPPVWLLDLAAAYGLRIVVGIPWAEHICFLSSSAVRAEIRGAIADGVRACRDSPATFAYLVGNEIPPDVVRWHGAKQVRAFLRDLVSVAKDGDPTALVSYANYPCTEYLDIDFTDFLSFNVYLHKEKDFRSYLARLHNLAEDKPLVLSEFGIDSIREGVEGQAQILDRKLASSFKTGAAGTIVFSWTDEWFTGGFAIQDWAFGLVDRDRHKKPAFYSVQQYYQSLLPPQLLEYPKVSVVVCTYNAERTLDSCLASLERLNYPNYEVIVVNDGSTDASLEIARKYDYIRLITQENKGLSVARNVGIAAAEGEIIAYTDSDCVADPDWLIYLVDKFLSSGLSAVGGPNLPPPEDALIPACVAVSPGGPTHVLLNDEVAEHIAGCNMAFRRAALAEIGGFDPLFHAAGDDVDLCWRLQDQGYTIGFSPAAIVWHFRRNTVAAYLKQQRGYGKAEALVYFKHPYRFNLLGQPRWFGRIYGGLYSTFLIGQPTIYSGVFGRGFFQMLYQPPASLFGYLPLTLEWNLAIALFGALSLLSSHFPWVAIVMLLISWGWSVAAAVQAPIDSRFQGIKARLLVATLIYLGPLVRSLERYRWRFKGLTQMDAIECDRLTQKPEVVWHKSAFYLSYWTEAGMEKESLLLGAMELLGSRKYFIIPDRGWSSWDLEVYRGIWSKAQIKVCTENHGSGKRLLRVRCGLKLTQLAKMTAIACISLAVAAIALGRTELGAIATIASTITATTILYQYIRLGRILYYVMESVAQRLYLLPTSNMDDGQ